MDDVGQTILVIDGGNGIRDTLRYLLRTQGCHVLGARNGPEALAVLRAVRVDAMVIDADLQAFGVTELLDRRIDDGALARISAVVASADGRVDATISGDRVLRKPFRTAALMIAVVAVCRSHQHLHPIEPVRRRGASLG